MSSGTLCDANIIVYTTNTINLFPLLCFYINLDNASFHLFPFKILLQATSLHFDTNIFVPLHLSFSLFLGTSFSHFIIKYLGVAVTFVFVIRMCPSTSHFSSFWHQFLWSISFDVLTLLTDFICSLYYQISWCYGDICFRHSNVSF